MKKLCLFMGVLALLGAMVLSLYAITAGLGALTCQGIALAEGQDVPASMPEDASVDTSDGAAEALPEPMEGSRVESTADGLPVEGQDDFTFADYFRTQWLDKLMQYACVLLGAVTAVAASLRRVNSAHAALQKDSAAMLAAQQDIGLAQRQLADTKQTYYDTVQAVQQAVDACTALYDQTAAMRTETRQAIEAMREALRIAFCSDPALVNAGCAKQIADLLEVPHEQTDA